MTFGWSKCHRAGLQTLALLLCILLGLICVAAIEFSEVQRDIR